MLDLTKTGQPVTVAIGTPIGESVKPVFVLSLLGIYQGTDPDKVRIVWVPSEGSNIAENQNVIVDAARAKNADYILFHESDNAAPSDALMRLLSHGKDIVGATYAFKDPKLLAQKLRGEEVTYRMMGHELDGTAVTLASLIRGEPLRKVNFVPMGMTLISMKAIDAVEALLAKKTEAPEGKRSPVFVHNVSYPLENPRGIISTTDSAFCGFARDAGLDVWLDAPLSLQMEHHGNCAFALIPDSTDEPNPVHELQSQLEEMASPA
jgi:hypothetical protein